MEAPRGRGSIYTTLTSALDGVSGHCHLGRALPPGTLWLGGWVGHSWSEHRGKTLYWESYLSSCNKKYWENFHCGLPDCDAVWTCRWVAAFLRNIWRPCPQIVCSSETLVAPYKSTWRHNPEIHHGNFHRRENLKSHTELPLAGCDFILYRISWLLLVITEHEVKY
jgi:hypothetical protein